MSRPFAEILSDMTAALPKSPPFEPSAFAKGIAEELRDLAEQIENGALTITHFSFTWQDDSAKRRLEIEAG